MELQRDLPLIMIDGYDRIKIASECSDKPALLPEHPASVAHGLYPAVPGTDGELLLIETKMSILDVELAVGFSNPSHFCKIFKDYMNRSPAKFRRENLT